MNTAQNYVGRGSYATRSTNGTKKIAQEAPRKPLQHPSHSYCREYLNLLWSQGEITADEFAWSTLITVTDESMVPMFNVGGMLVIYPINTYEYKNKINQIVALSLINAHERYIIGQIKELDDSKIKLSSYNPNFQDMLIPTMEIEQLYQITHVHRMPVY